MQELDARGAPGSEAIAIASLSDAGLVRAENQDAIALIENTSGERLLLVADGMGGHRGGETAARICVKTIERVFRDPHGTPEQRLIRGLELANEEVYSHALANPELRGMGTTAVVALLAPDGGAWVAWIGDSRLYRLRAGKLEQLTQDHSLMAEWITIGVITADAAKTHPRRHELTRALGQAPDVVVDLLAIELCPGDRLLLCSDGLHGCVADSVLTRALKKGDPDVAACALVDAANANGGPDNVSVIVAVLPEVPEPASSPEPEPVPAAVPEPVPEPVPEAAPETVTEPEPAAAAAPEPMPAQRSEPEPRPTPEPEPDLAFEPEFAFSSAPAPEPEPEPAVESAADLGRAPIECEPESAAELSARAFVESPAQPEAPGAIEGTADAEASFAELGEGPGAETHRNEEPREPEAEPALASPLEREPFPTPSAPIQIPLMTPVRARRGLDATSLVVGMTITLVAVGLGLALWSYTDSRSAPESSASQPSPAVVHSAPSNPVPRATSAPKPIETPSEKRSEGSSETPAAQPAVQPELTPPPQPVVAMPAEPPPPQPAIPTPTAAPVPRTREAPKLPSVPAAVDPSLEPQASVGKFELTPEVERFLTVWLGALATEDQARLAALGFPDEPLRLAGASGSRDGFRLVAADIDEERSGDGRVYLRLIVSYAFRDPNGRFRTQDERRFILRDVGGRLRFEGRWRQ